MKIKKMMHSCCRRMGFDIIPYAQSLEKPFDVLPMVVKARLQPGKEFFFVQVGAHDGVLDDPLKDLIFEYRLHGLFVEPLPDAFANLKKNYSGRSEGLIFENAAIAETSGSLLIYRVKQDVPMEYWKGMASFRKSHLLREGIPDAYIDECLVQTMTMSELLAKHHINKIDLLQVDAEGFDDNVVKAALETNVLPGIINYEYCHISPKRRAECKKQMDRHGYRFINVGKDTLAVKEGG